MDKVIELKTGNILHVKKISNCFSDNYLEAEYQIYRRRKATERVISRVKALSVTLRTELAQRTPPPKGEAYLNGIGAGGGLFGGLRQGRTPICYRE